MRNSIFLTIIVLILTLTGCSKSSFESGDPTQAPMTQPTESDDVITLASGIMNLDDGSIDLTARCAESYFDVTSFIGSHFSFEIKGLLPPDILDIELTIENVSMITVYDVIIIFDNLYGKKVMNPDSYIDIYEPWVIKPFIAFRKEDPFRAFPWIADSEQLLLKYSEGSSPFVDFTILAHLGGNTGGVYEITNWQVSGTLTPDGGSAIVSVGALDHQKDVTTVVADTSVITGGYTFFSPTANPEVWQANITNSQQAPIGSYTVPVMAKSPASPPYQTYNFFELHVQSTDATSFGEDVLLYASAGDESFPSTTGRHNMIADGDSFYYSFANHYSSPMGGNMANILFSKSTDAGLNWTEPVFLTAEPAFGDILHYSSLAKRGNNLYLCYQRVKQLSNYSFEILKSKDDGETWDLFYESGSEKRSPTIAVDKLSADERVYVAYIKVGTGDNYDLYVDTYEEGTGWSSNRVNDTPGTGKGIGKPDIAFNSVTDKVMVAWSDENPASGSGSRISFDISSDGKVWGTDILVNDSWTSNEKELNPIISINPSSGIPGILFDSSVNHDSVKVMFIKALDQDGSVFGSPINLSGTLSEAYASSLQCDPDGRWLASWYGSPEIYGMYDAYFMESIDNGATWSNKQILNDIAMARAYDPQIASNGSTVCAGWMDYRDPAGKIWLDRGTR